MGGPKVVYVWDKNLERQSNKISVIKRRATVVHSLISAYGLLNRMEVIPSAPTTYKRLCKVHSKEYIDALRLANKTDFEMSEDTIDKFNLGYDCPLLYRMYNFIRIIAGASIEAAKALCSGKSKRAINWHGGWHHAQRNQSQGFCYVNDIAIAIETLLCTYPRVLYIDLDVHHGNGVENLFLSNSRVMTFSLHLLEPGFFPCTGLVEDVGAGEGQFYTVNVPLKAGLSDVNLVSTFDRLSKLIYDKFEPSAVVVQCGADSLNKDPLGHFSLSLRSIGECVKRVLSWDLPTLFLGGGGYNPSNAARLWTYLTSIITDEQISNEIPEHKYFERYGQGYSYELHISPGQREDLNTPQYLKYICDKIEENLLSIKPT